MLSPMNNYLSTIGSKSTLLFLSSGVSTDLTTLLVIINNLSSVSILKVSASPELFANQTKYPGFQLIQGNLKMDHGSILVGTI